MSKLRVLRIRRPPTLLTAQAYEELFDAHLGTVFDVSVAPLESWCTAILGDPGSSIDWDVATRRFRDLSAGYDFFSPNYECIPLAPLLLAVRNRAEARVRLLFIAHAAGAYSFEWALMRPLLAAGDVIVAPSESARRTIEFLCPEVAAFVRTIPHPMARLTSTRAQRRDTRVVSLGRVHGEKLIHRQLDAMATLRRRGTRSLRLSIGGPLDDGGWPGAHPYARALQERTRRLGLEDCVEFTGPIRGQGAKSEFLSQARVVLNLSVTIEESCPKTPVEALGVGVPVLGTDWNGLRDTVGPCGRLVSVRASNDVTEGVDVDAQAVADALEALLDAPPPAEQCVAWTEQFVPEVILPRYRVALEEAVESSASTHTARSWPDLALSAAPDTGLLANAGPLGAFSWRELFEAHLSWCDDVRRSWTGRPPPTRSDGARLRFVVVASVEPTLKRFFARVAPPASSTLAVLCREHEGDLLDRLAHAAVGGGLLASRAACLVELVAAQRPELARRVLDAAIRDGVRPSFVHYWRAEIGAAVGDGDAALDHAFACAGARALGESDWAVVRALAKVARRTSMPGAALPVLMAWLERFPDSQESGAVWLDACVAGLRAGSGGAELAERCHAMARTLLGDLPIVRRCGDAVEAARHAELLVV